MIPSDEDLVTVMGNRRAVCRNRFFEWASKMKLTENGTLLLKENGKIILAQEEFKLAKNLNEKFKFKSYTDIVQNLNLKFYLFYYDKMF